MGKFKTANYWPFMKWDIIGLSALNSNDEITLTTVSFPLEVKYYK